MHYICPYSSDKSQSGGICYSGKLQEPFPSRNKYLKLVQNTDSGYIQQLCSNKRGCPRIRNHNIRIEGLYKIDFSVNLLHDSINSQEWSRIHGCKPEVDASVRLNCDSDVWCLNSLEAFLLNVFSAFTVSGEQNLGAVPFKPPGYGNATTNMTQSHTGRSE